ncbi:hypothetical protein PS15p_201183 [Mucor circinelloides]
MSFNNIEPCPLAGKSDLPIMKPLSSSLKKQRSKTTPQLADNHKRSPGFNGCPDCIITIFQHQTDDGANVGFGEVKRQSMAGNHYLVNWDLLPLAVFGKNAAIWRYMLLARTSPFI